MTEPSVHGAGPHGSDAAALATVLLDGLDARLAHTTTVAAQIERVADLVEPEWQYPVRDAAWLHDVGYNPDLVLTGFHPLDGARWLRDHAWPTETCRLVAWHTESIEEARMYELDAALMTEFDSPPRLPAAALTWADLTSSPTGARWDAHSRLTEILDRYPPGSAVHEATQASVPALLASVRDIESLLHDRR